MAWYLKNRNKFKNNDIALKLAQFIGDIVFYIPAKFQLLEGNLHTQIMADQIGKALKALRTDSLYFQDFIIGEGDKVVTVQVVLVSGIYPSVWESALPKSPQANEANLLGNPENLYVSQRVTSHSRN